MAVNDTVHAEDLVPVRSRISWGAIVAGSVLALALYFLLTLLGGAIGLSIGDRTSAQNLGAAAAVWAIAVTAVCLFVGGFVASQFTVGENKTEAAVYGLLVWAVVFAMLLWLMATGVRAGFNAMVGVATAGTAAADATGRGDWEAAARNAGVPADQIEGWRQKAREAPTDARRAVEDPANRQAAADAATRVTWYTFLGTLVSMLAAGLGGYVGSGPTIRLFAVPAARGRYAAVRA
jgi:hypothetical protein